MSDEKRISRQLLEQAAKEQSFRKQILSELAAQLRKKETPISLKILIVLGLLVFVGISFVFTIFLIHGILAIFKENINFKPFNYVVVISAEVALLLVISIPLIVKAGDDLMSSKR